MLRSKEHTLDVKVKCPLRNAEAFCRRPVGEFSLVKGEREFLVVITHRSVEFLVDHERRCRLTAGDANQFIWMIFRSFHSLNLNLLSGQAFWVISAGRGLIRVRLV